MTYDEPMEHEQEPEPSQKDTLVALTTKALEDLDYVLSSLPQGRSRDTAIHYLSTTTLWIKQTFDEGK